MRNRLFLLVAAFIVFSSAAFAQTGTLRGGAVVMSNGTNTVTLKMPSSNVHTWTLTLPADTAFGTQYLYDDGTGTLHWGVPVGSTSTGTVLYNTKGPQTLTALSTDLFNVGYNTSDPGPAVGALVKV